MYATVRGGTVNESSVLTVRLRLTIDLHLALCFLHPQCFSEAPYSLRRLSLLRPWRVRVPILEGASRANQSVKPLASPLLATTSLLMQALPMLWSSLSTRTHATLHQSSTVARSSSTSQRDHTYLLDWDQQLSRLESSTVSSSYLFCCDNMN